MSKSLKRKRWFSSSLLIAIFVVLLFCSALSHYILYSLQDIALRLTFGIISLSIGMVSVYLFYRFKANGFDSKTNELQRKYPNVYKVKSLTTVPKVVFVAKTSCIATGDYGWQAEPAFEGDGLVYLIGLTDSWQVAWYAGFSPSDLALVGCKPKSEYLIPYSWRNSGLPDHKCPYSIQNQPANNETLGLPIPNYTKGLVLNHHSMQENGGSPLLFHLLRYFSRK